MRMRPSFSSGLLSFGPTPSSRSISANSGLSTSGRMARIYRVEPTWRVPYPRAMTADFSTRLARARFRAWHRGTREADYMIGGFFDRYHAGWDEAALTWFEALL